MEKQQNEKIFRHAEYNIVVNRLPEKTLSILKKFTKKKKTRRKTEKSNGRKTVEADSAGANDRGEVLLQRLTDRSRAAGVVFAEKIV